MGRGDPPLLLPRVRGGPRRPGVPPGVVAAALGRAGRVTRDQLEAVLEDLDVEELRAALLMVGAFARDGRTDVASALWFGLAEACRAPTVPYAVTAAHRAATEARRPATQPNG